MIMPREKREIQKEDIMPLDVYTKNRRELRKSIVDFKKNRRIALGPYATFYFESYETMLAQVQEMLYIEILEEFKDHIVKGYGDYDFILNNFLKPIENLENIYFDIIQNYLKFGYYKEGIQCIEQVIEQLVNDNAYVNPDIYINILIDYVIATYYLNPSHSKCYIVVNKIFLMCYKHPILKQEIKQHIGRLDVYLTDLNITKPDFLK